MSLLQNAHAKKRDTDQIRHDMRDTLGEHAPPHNIQRMQVLETEQQLGTIELGLGLRHGAVLLEKVAQIAACNMET